MFNGKSKKQKNKLLISGINFCKKHFIALLFSIPAIICIISGLTSYFINRSTIKFIDSDFIGAWFALAGVFIFAATLFYQIKEYKLQIEELKKSVEAQTNTSKALEEQKDIQKLSQFESTFFNLLRNQQEIAKNIQEKFYYIDRESIDFTSISGVKNKIIDGRNFFKEIKRELSKIFVAINYKYFFKYIPEQNESTLHTIAEIEENTALDPDEKDQKITDLINSEKNSFTNSLYIKNDTQWKEIRSLNLTDQIAVIYGLLFQIYHTSLGHYFRHLYHIISYTDNFFTENEKIQCKAKIYTDIIQAQMSSDELTITYYNAFAFPNLFALIEKYDFLENLTQEDLIDTSHYINKNIKIKSRRELINLDKFKTEPLDL